MTSTNASGRHVITRILARRTIYRARRNKANAFTLTNGNNTFQCGVVFGAIRRRGVHELIGRFPTFIIYSFTRDNRAIRVINHLLFGKVFKLRIRLLHRLITIMNRGVVMGQLIITDCKTTSKHNVNNRSDPCLKGNELGVRNNRTNRPLIYLRRRFIHFHRVVTVRTLCRLTNDRDGRKYFIVVAVSVR